VADFAPDFFRSGEADEGKKRLGREVGAKFLQVPPDARDLRFQGRLAQDLQTDGQQSLPQRETAANSERQAEWS
jgi:hypothetical protein